MPKWVLLIAGTVITVTGLALGSIWGIGGVLLIFAALALYVEEEKRL